MRQQLTDGDAIRETAAEQTFSATAQEKRRCITFDTPGILVGLQYFESSRFCFQPRG